MTYSDWIPLLVHAVCWHSGLKVGIVHHLPGFLLFVPWYLSKRLKGYFARVHIHYGVSSYLSDPLSQPEICMFFFYCYRTQFTSYQMVCDSHQVMQKACRSTINCLQDRQNGVKYTLTCFLSFPTIPRRVLSLVHPSPRPLIPPRPAAFRL
jgi:hypothetical protein